MSYIKRRMNAIAIAVSGLFIIIRKEAHMKIHFLAAVLVIIAGFYFDIRSEEWLFVVLCIALVMAFEVVNTAIEKICDMITLDEHPTIKYVKDISSAAVLLICLFAVITGVIIFSPYIFK